MAQASVKEPFAKIKLQTPFELYNLNSNDNNNNDTRPSEVVTTDRAEMMKLFEEMWRVRRMEMASDALYKGKLIRGFCHLGIGQVRSVLYEIYKLIVLLSIRCFNLKRRLFQWV